MVAPLPLFTLDLMQTKAQKSVNLQNTYYAGSPGQWDKRIVDQASDVPSIIFFFIKSCIILCKNHFNLVLYLFIKLQK